MKIENIPQELINILDERAGKMHSRTGIVVSTLAEILTKYDELKLCDKNPGAKWMCPRCLGSGVSAVQPLCDTCDYKIKMIEISDNFYNSYHYERWKIRYEELKIRYEYLKAKELD